jgi:hypothetical protein
VKITFDPGRHAYTVNGAPVPSVSRVCDVVDPPSSFYRPEHATRGRYVHSACEYADRGVLKTETLDLALVPYVEGWRAFRRDVDCYVRVTEAMRSEEHTSELQSPL